MSAGMVLLMYQYYYGYGDTFGYFYCGRKICEALWEAPLVGMELLLQPPESYSSLAISYADHPHFSSRDSRFMAQVVGLLSVVTFKSYLTVSLLLSYLSFVGCWKIFRVFQQLYPGLHRPLALAVLFVPSVFFWGVGLMKESLVLFGLGLLVDGLFSIFVLPRRRFRHFSYLLVGAIVLFKIKPYLLVFCIIAFLPLVIHSMVRHLNTARYRFFAACFWYVLVGIFCFMGVAQMGKMIDKYDPQEALQYLAVVQQVQLKVSEQMGGSGYDLGAMDPSFSGLLAKSGAAINVTFFRPWPWDVRKVINLPAMIESLVTLVLTLVVVFRLGLRRLVRRLASNPVVLFCLLFSLTTGVIVGLVAFNFGTLVRYKAPVLPFYFIALILLFYTNGKTATDDPSHHLEPIPDTSPRID